MRAAVNRRYGPPSVVTIEEVPDPMPGPGEVLVKVACATVNRTDCGLRGPHPWFVRFFTGLRTPRHTINGSEFAGTVSALGPGTTSFAIGDRVFGFSEDRLGAHAQYLVMPSGGAIAPTPPGISDEIAAASTEASHYALASLRAAGVRRGDAVMVYGATGAIGSAAVQLLHGRGVRVTAVCASAHVEMVAGLGADRVIDHTDLTSERQVYDVVFDAVGKSSFRACRRLLAPQGVYASTDLGPLSQNPLLTLITAASPGRRAMLPIPPKRDRESVAFIASQLASGSFRPVIDRTYPLPQIVQAYEYVETGQKVGNVIIRVAPSS